MSHHLKDGGGVAKRSPRLVSIVVPAYHEEGGIHLLVDAVVRAMGSVPWELVIVDDGSTDSTYTAICKLAAVDNRVRGLRLSRNFGHQYALLAGLARAAGDVVVSMDADLQHPPELIPELLARWSEGCNIVHTRRDPEGLGWFKRRTSDWFYAVFSRLSGIKMAPGMSDFRLLDRRVVDVILSMESSELFLRGMVQWVGFRSATVPYKVGMRAWGASKYSLGKMVRFAVQGITSFSTLPLRLGIALGFLTSVLAALEFAYVIVVWLRGEPVPGWASLAGLISILFSVAFLLIGFLGVYVAHVFDRVQRRPLFVIEESTDTAMDDGTIPGEKGSPAP